MRHAHGIVVLPTPEMTLARNEHSVHLIVGFWHGWKNEKENDDGNMGCVDILGDGGNNRDESLVDWFWGLPTKTEQRE